MIRINRKSLVQNINTSTSLKCSLICMLLLFILIYCDTSLSLIHICIRSYSSSSLLLIVLRSQIAANLAQVDDARLVLTFNLLHWTIFSDINKQFKIIIILNLNILIIIIVIIIVDYMAARCFLLVWSIVWKLLVIVVTLFTYIRLNIVGEGSILLLLILFRKWILPIFLGIGLVILIVIQVFSSVISLGFHRNIPLLFFSWHLCNNCLSSIHTWGGTILRLLLAAQLLLVLHIHILHFNLVVLIKFWLVLMSRLFVFLIENICQLICTLLIVLTNQTSSA